MSSRTTIFQCRKTSSTTKVIDSATYHQTKKQQASQKQRPTLHLSSAPKSKFQGTTIGSSHPIVPHPFTTPRKFVKITKQCPPYAATKLKEDDDENELFTSILSYKYHGHHHHLGGPSGLMYKDWDRMDNSVEKMRQTCQVASKILQTACSIVQTRPNITTEDIDNVIHDEIVTAGAYPSFLHLPIVPASNRMIGEPSFMEYFPKSITTSINEVICGGIPDSRTLMGGDLISINTPVYQNGVHGDACATVIVPHKESDLEETTTRAIKLQQATKNALHAAIDVAHVGNTIGDILLVIRNHAKMNGYTRCHGIDFGCEIGKELACCVGVSFFGLFSVHGCFEVCIKTKVYFWLCLETKFSILARGYANT